MLVIAAPTSRPPLPSEVTATARMHSLGSRSAPPVVVTFVTSWLSRDESPDARRSTSRTASVAIAADG